MDGRFQKKSLLLTEIEGDVGQVQDVYNQHAHRATDECPQDAHGKTLQHEQGHDLAGWCADGRHGPDLPNPFIHGHDHHVQNTDEHQGHEHKLDKEGHDVEHPGDVEEW